MQIDIKKLRIDILAIIGFIVVSLLYCYPQLEGKKLQQSDNINYQAMAREAIAFHDSTGKDVLWSNSMFGGMPTYTTYVGATNTNYPAYAQVFLQSVGKPAYFFLIAMLCFYLLMRVLGINKWLGMVGAMAYAFATFNSIIIVAGHETQMLTLGYLPAALAGLYLIFKEKWLVGAAVFGIAIALIFSNNHFQVIFYMMIMLVCFAACMLYVAIKEGRVAKFFISAGIALVVFIAGVGPSVPSIWTSSEYAKQTMRGGESELSGHDKKTSGGLDKEYAFRWSNGIGETFCIMIPYLYGGGSAEPADMAPKTLEAIGGNAEELPLYWGPQPFLNGPIYFGAIICFLFVLGLMVVRSPHKWWILGVSAFCIMLSWGKNFEGINYFLFDHMPLLNKFRTVTMALVIPQFLFPLLGIWAVQEVMERKDDPQTWKQVRIAAGITGGLCVIIGLGGSLFFNFTGAGDARLPDNILKLMKEDRANLAMTSALKSAAFILLAAGLLWAFLKNKIKPVVLISGIALLVAVDLIPVARDYMNEKNFVDASDYESIFQPRDVDKQILRDPDPYYRVLDLTRDPYNDAEPAYFHKMVGGYHPAKMEIYQDLIDRQMSHGFNGAVLDMLNTKYIIVGGQKQAPGVIPNPNACGNAWFVDEVKWANTADDEMNGLNAPQIQDTTAMPDAFAPKKTAVMRTTYKEELGNYQFGKDSSAYVKLARYGLDDISFTSKNSKDGLAVFSDIYYEKGWKAYVDGKETPIMRTDYVLRAIKIPAGSHSIEFHFRPKSFYTGQKVATVSSILLILLFLGAFYPLIKKDKPTTEKKG